MIYIECRLACEWAGTLNKEKVEGEDNHDFTPLNYANLVVRLRQMRIKPVLLTKAEN